VKASNLSLIYSSRGLLRCDAV